eukprot:TRINITY_DN22421_c0_g1_i1.p1 TRINITY_DN22421_c0_g1~~TRINITY_DN22421_c0_g1_i1.p1  ORF type:complete len:513 (+),score=203.42 TRINITY_DN22421_c0_g1_i1:82-1620(+)
MSAAAHADPAAAGAECMRHRAYDVFRPFQVVVAADSQGGIGKAGKLPWRLRGDMKFFKELTMAPSSKSVPAAKRNCCIMGRSTWQSIPAKFRPLDGRLNLIISTTLDQEQVRKELADPSKGEDVHVVRSGLEGALDLLCSEEFVDKVDRVFLIGGAGLIQNALSPPVNRALQSVHITRVQGDFACDVKIDFPEAERVLGYRLVNTSEEHEEEQAKYRFQTYQRVNREEQQYLDLVADIMETGNRKMDRTGTGTLSKFGAQMRFSLRDGQFPLLTTKRVFWRGVAEELLWFIRGCTDGNQLKAKGVGIWDGNGTREFLDSRGLHHREEGDLGPIYGFQWRHFGAKYTDRNGDYEGQGVDQLAEVIETIRKNPEDRRIIMSAWNPCALKEMALPPCHVMCQFYVFDGELSCQMYQRSCDMGLGVPFNIASYALLTCIIAHMTGLRPGEFVHTLGDAHVYSNHVEPLKEQLKREPRPFPALKIRRHHDRIEDYTMDDFVLMDYAPYPTIKMEMAV